jgi:undecaprenyl-diphosphatase
MSRNVSWKIFGLAGVFLLTSVMFVLAGVYDSFPGDEPVLVQIQELRTGWLDTTALALDTIGGQPLAVGSILAVAAALMLLRRPADAVIVLFSLALLFIGHELKQVVDRPRPEYVLLGLEPESPGFPSGHSMYALIFGGLLIYLAGQVIPSLLLKRWLQYCLAALILAMGVSRVYLGVHWPSDVIGGFLYGGLALAGLIALRYLWADSNVVSFRRRILPWQS